MHEIRAIEEPIQCSLALLICSAEQVTGQALVDNAVDQLKSYEFSDHQITVVWADTTHHYPLIAQRLAKSGSFEGILCMDARSDVNLPHRRAQIENLRRSCQNIGLQYNIPIIFSIPKKDPEQPTDNHSSIKSFSRLSIDHILSVISILRQID